MPTFEIEVNGKTYEVEAPSQEAALGAVQAQQSSPNRDRGVLWPVSYDKGGNARFDPDAGLLGAVKRAVTLPGDVYKGRVDPNSPEVVERAFDFASVFSPVGTAARVGEKAIPGVLKSTRKAEVKAPTAEALKEASDMGYDRARGMGVDYASQAVKTLADDMQRSLESEGILAELSPKTFKILERLQQPPEGSVASLDGLIAARRALNNAAGDFTNKTEQMAAKRAIERLDEFLLGPDPASVVAGPAPAAAKAIKDAQGNYAAAKRSEKITGAQERAELNAAVANSGLNIDNQIRQRMRDIVANPKQARGYSQEELAEIEEIARGTLATNTSRYLGNLLGGGGGLGAVASGAAGAAGGASFGGPEGVLLGTLPPLIGYGSKKLSGALVGRQVGALDEMVRQRSPLYEQLLSDAPMEVISPEKRAALIRMLLLSETPQQ